MNKTESTLAEFRVRIEEFEKRATTMEERISGLERDRVQTDMWRDWLAASERFNEQGYGSLKRSVQLCEEMSLRVNLLEAKAGIPETKRRFWARVFNRPDTR